MNQIDQTKAQSLLTLGRGFFALALGVAILFWPDKARPVLGNFIGGFIMASGVMTLRWWKTEASSRTLPLVAGILGILAGLVVATRVLLGRYTTAPVLGTVLGGVALVVGLIHLTGGFRTPGEDERKRSLESIVLGVYEVILGVLLLLHPAQRGPEFHLVLSGWALMGSIILIGQAVRLWPRRAVAEEAPNSGPGSDEV
jgi:uncharacterized membrane protein HdeD (DUF308 family)